MEPLKPDLTAILRVQWILWAVTFKVLPSPGIRVTAVVLEHPLGCDLFILVAMFPRVLDRSREGYPA